MRNNSWKQKMVSTEIDYKNQTENELSDYNVDM